MIIQHKFSNNENTSINIVEGFRPDPSDYDEYDKKYKPVLNQPLNQSKQSSECGESNNFECLPYPIDFQPEEKKFKELKDGADNLEGRNFLFAKYHSQLNNVGGLNKNKKVDIRPESINPQLGVDPWTQSIVNINWKKDNKVYQQNTTSNIWDKLVVK
jgi:hypothetical protein